MPYNTLAKFRRSQHPKSPTATGKASWCRRAVASASFLGKLCVEVCRSSSKNYAATSAIWAKCDHITYCIERDILAWYSGTGYAHRPFDKMINRGFLLSQNFDSHRLQVARLPERIKSFLPLLLYLVCSKSEQVTFKIYSTLTVL